MLVGPDFFLDVICLSVYQPNVETKRILDSVVSVYDELSKSDDTLNTDLNKLYISIIRDITSTDLDLSNKAEATSLLVKFKQNPYLVKEPETFKQLELILSNEEEVSSRRILALKKRITNWITWSIGDKALRKLFGKSSKAESCIDSDEQDIILGGVLDGARDLVKALEGSTFRNDDTLEFLDMSCKNSISSGIVKHKERRNENAFRLGLQGLNKMFGMNGGPIPGQFILFAALSHNYKSGILMDIARWLCTLNTPVANGKGKPTIVFTSLENEVFENLIDWFKSEYSHLHGAPPKDMNDDDIINFVHEQFSKMGYNLIVYRKDGASFGYSEYEAMLNQLREQGINVVASIIDYITLMRRDDSGLNEADKTQTLVNRVRNYASRTGICTFSAIQLNGGAYEVSMSGQTNVVKKFNAAHLAGCKAIRSEADVLIYMHIEKNHLGDVYLTFYCDKIRYDKLREEDKFFGYKFCPVESGVSILNDVDGEPKFVRDIYVMDDGEASADSLQLF